MTDRAETTRVTLKYTAGNAPCPTSLGPALAATLTNEKLLVRGMHALENGMYFELEGVSVSVTCSPERPGEVRIVAMSEDDGSAGSPLARLRVRACSSIARGLSSEVCPRRIEWRHRGGFYITEGGKIAVVSGMRGTSGAGARRRAAARAFSMYGHDRSKARSRRERRQPVFRIGGKSRQSTPAKLAQYAINSTLCVLFLPIGAAVMTHQLLRGGSLKSSARMLALTGTSASVTAPGFLRVLSGLM